MGVGIYSDIEDVQQMSSDLDQLLTFESDYEATAQQYGLLMAYKNR
jgi:hypothetical protein